MSPTKTPDNTALVEVRDLQKHFRAGGSWVRPNYLKAVENIDLQINAGEVLGQTPCNLCWYQSRHLKQRRGQLSH